jgi:hypothetical protein
MPASVSDAGIFRFLGFRFVWLSSFPGSAKTSGALTPNPMIVIRKKAALFLPMTSIRGEVNDSA